MAQLPKPFSRPSISLGGAVDATPREWRTIAVSEIHAGDLIADVGLIDHKEVFRLSDPSGFRVTVTVITGVEHHFSWNLHAEVPTVLAFVPVRTLHTN